MKVYIEPDYHDMGLEILAKNNIPVQVILRDEGAVMIPDEHEAAMKQLIAGDWDVFDDAPPAGDPEALEILNGLRG